MQATINEAVILCLTKANVNSLDLFLSEEYGQVTVAEKKEIKENRLKEVTEYDKQFMQLHFQCETIEELRMKINKC